MLSSLILDIPLGDLDRTVYLVLDDFASAFGSLAWPETDMIVCQMGVTHALIMRSFGKLNRSDNIQQQDSNALTIARLTKAFASQVDALAKLRRGREQRVVVEHVHIHSGAQAIVGAVTHTGGPRAAKEIWTTPLLTTAAHSR
jgi:hypothetical protein